MIINKANTDILARKRKMFEVLYDVRIRDNNVSVAYLSLQW